MLIVLTLSKTLNLKKKISDYWDNGPCNIRYSKKKLFSKEYFEEVRKKKYFVEPHIKSFADHKKFKNKNVLEIGFGMGTDAIEFIKNGANYHGLEFSKKSLEITKKRITTYKLDDRLPLIKLGDAEKLSKYFSKQNNFHLIYSWGVIHHTPNMKACFDEIYKIANKNTLIKIMLYAKNSYKNFLVNDTPYRYEAQKGVPIAYRVDVNDIKEITKNKFKIIDSYQDFIFPYKINYYKKNIYKKIDHFDVMPKKIFDLLQKNIGEHLMITLKKIEK